VGLLIQKLLVHIENPNPSIRASVLCCTNQFLMIRSEAIWSHFDSYMNILYKCTNDPSGKVKRFVCQAFNNVIELKPEVLVPVLDSVISFMLHVMQESEKEPALEAADFFLIFSEQDLLHIHIQPYLSR
jgi:transportin-1